MTPHWERLKERPAEKGPLFFDAVLTPHRSLSRKAFVYVICGFAAVDVAIVTVFLLQAPIRWRSFCCSTCSCYGWRSR